MQQLPVLLWMVSLPLLGAVLVLLVGRSGVQQVRRMALTNVLLTLVLAVLMVTAYEPQLQYKDGSPRLTQMNTTLFWLGTTNWVPEEPAPERAPDAAAVTSEKTAPRKFLITGLDIRFALGVDGISLWLIALSAVLMVPSVLVSWEAVQDRPAAYYALMLVLESGLIGVFAAQDIILFYIFFEFTLIPLFFMIGIWGGHQRRWAARKFFVFTLAGSLLTFLGLLFIVLLHASMAGNSHLTFSIPQLTAEIPRFVASNAAAAKDWARASPWIFLALFAGFAIKVPLFPFHTWLPLAHVEAPTAGSVLLAGVLLKIGSYGFLRFALPLVPDACWYFFDTIALLSVVGIIYGALLALAQDDIKKLVAYSSVSHMGFCLLGLFALNSVGITGGLLQMINHGLSTGALFALVGMLYERYHTRDIESYGGLARKLPIMAFFFSVVAFSSIGLPGLNGFTGEVTCLIGMFDRDRLYAACSLTGIIFGAWYMLSLVRRTMFGRLREPLQEGGAHGGGGHGHAPVADMNSREILALAPILALIVWIGVYPQFFIDRMEPSVTKIAGELEASRERYAGRAESRGWRVAKTVDGRQ